MLDVQLCPYPQVREQMLGRSDTTSRERQVGLGACLLDTVATVSFTGTSPGLDSDIQQQ